MKNEFVPYYIALAMKGLGFNEPCSAFYKLGDFEIYYDTILQSKKVKFRNNSELNFYGDLKEKISAPLYPQAFRWFEENYDDAITVRTYKMSNGVRWYDYSVNEFGGRCKDREEAELACLRKLIEIVKNEK